MSDIAARNLDRRSFLRGSVLFAGAVGLSVLPAFAAQQPPPSQPQEPPKQDPPKKEEPKDPFAEGDKGKKEEKKLIDAEGREYRVCPQCGYNMYKQGRMWVCENCGYSYVE